jgi:hypothetical protein
MDIFFAVRFTIPRFPSLLFILSLFFIAVECKAQNENGNDFLLPIDRTLPNEKSKTITLHFKDSPSLKLFDYPNTKYSSMWPAETLRQVLIDLDGDGSKELIVQHFSDGAHRSYIFNLFKSIDESNFEEILSRENVLVKEDSILRIWLYGELGLYRSCYGCYVKTPQYLDATIDLIYNKGELILTRNEELNRLIIENLEFLKNRGIPDINNFESDDATRKSYLLHLVTYHFNNHCEMSDTKRLFDEYYDHIDHSKTWTEIESILRKQEVLLQVGNHIKPTIDNNTD